LIQNIRDLREHVRRDDSEWPFLPTEWTLYFRHTAGCALSIGARCPQHGGV
jgi:hypothetical protein